MEIKYTEEQLNTIDKSFLIHLLLQQQEQLEALTKKLHATNEKMQQMMEQIILAKTSAIIFSIVETAKANDLKPYNYVQYLLEEIPKHMNDTNYSFLEDLLPWSENLPAEIRKS